ncbi:MAG: UDP-N-acetylmuramoyl-L-alanine--D-glutamate ligase [Hyphomonadaceae bacterium]|nr:UDP-N-acetylmuramoyl-L-alanine--D-glutamate ligase [Hyphomonadaceae bacterium]MBC6411996.1 UDP-N-acetylmuramoyl-L-alanine--D-glutamate ligase [Hyphomonadaceae bacterium]
MIKAETFRDKKVAVFGLGRTGITAALSLKAGGAEVLAWDDNPEAREIASRKGIPVFDFKKENWRTIDALVLSPGIPHKLPEPHQVIALAGVNNVPIICDIEIFAREVMSRAEEQRPKIIAVTGTNGKSTTTALITHILRECGKDVQMGGNIGRGVLDLDYIHRGSHYVLELSSYQLERTENLHANAAVFLNLTPDHLDRHGDMAGYEQAKRRIFLNQTRKDTVVIGVDQPVGKRICSELKAANGRTIIPISGRKSLGRGVCVIKGKLYCTTGSKMREVADLSKARALDGAHNWQNAAAAYAAVASLGINPEDIGKAILGFPGLVHRMEHVGSIGPVKFVNDSKATNANATLQALSAYDNIHWIVGGQAKEGGLESLRSMFPRVAKAYLIGEAAPDFRETLKSAKVEYKISGTLDMAVLCATRDALSRSRKNPVVLLSPACASFDQFRSYEVRGDKFRSQVRGLLDMFEREKAKHRARAAVA